MLAVTNLEKTFRSGKAEYCAVDNVSFEIPEGQFFTLLGPSGCGKTTILRCVAGLEQPSGGDIAIAGKSVFSSQKRLNLPTEARDVGMVFQSYAIWPHMSVFDNAAYPLRYGRARDSGRSRSVAGRRAAKVDVKKSVQRVLEQVGLSDHADRWATELSGGQQQRLALARALLGGAQLLLLDEPLSNLDAELRVSLRSELKDFQKRFGVTTLYVTHDQSEALSMSDGIAVMRHGRIAQVGPPSEIYVKPADAYVAKFVGGSNLLECRILRRSTNSVEVECSLGRLECATGHASTDPNAFIVMRPETIAVFSEDPGTSVGVTTALGTVSATDFLGEAVDLVVQCAQEVLRVRARPANWVEVGQVVWLRIPWQSLHLVPNDGLVNGDLEREDAELREECEVNPTQMPLSPL